MWELKNKGLLRRIAAGEHLSIRLAYDIVLKLPEPCSARVGLDPRQVASS